MIQNKTEIMEEVMSLICGAGSMEQACDDVFRILASLLPLRFLVLGFFDKNRQQAFLLSRTEAQGTRRICRFITFSDEQTQRANSLNFFQNITDLMVDTPTHPVALLYRGEGIELEPPFYISRFFHANIQQGSATFGFAPGKTIAPENLNLLNVLKMPFNIFISSQYRYWELAEINRRVEEDNVRLRKQVQGLEQTEIIGSSGGLREVTARLRQVAPLDVSLLVQGETGTGKEVLAKAAHELSLRRKGPFIALNCGAIPPSLIDNELFGHSKGSYTGATDVYRGRFERASGGTLFLDEVGELPLEVQARLLRVLEEKKVERIGATEQISVNFRLIAATHRDLKKMVDEGKFRQDLYYRLAVVSLTLPPLRERRQDIPPLVRYFVEQCAQRFGMMPPEVLPADMADLSGRDWQGNIRELRNTVEEAVALASSGRLSFRPSDAGEYGECAKREEAEALGRAACPIVSSAGEAKIALQAYDVMVKEYLEAAIRHCHGKIQGKGSAAELLGLNPNTLRAKLRKYGVTSGRKK